MACLLAQLITTRIAVNPLESSNGLMKSLKWSPTDVPQLARV